MTAVARPALVLGLCWGLLAGLLSGMLGIGGGLVIGPLLLMRGLPIRRATGTALVMVPLVALVGTLTELKLGAASLPWGLVGAISLGGLLGVRLGRLLAGRLSDRWLWRLFLSLLLATDLRLFWAAEGAAAVGAWASAASLGGLLIGLGAGLLAGIAAILFGVGGGVVVVPLLAFTVPGVGFGEASAVSLAAMIPTATLGSWTAWRDQRLAVEWLRPLLLGALPGAILGVYLRGHLISPRQLELSFAAFLAWVLWRLWGRLKAA